MQSEATGNYPVALRSAHERYLVDAPLRGCLAAPLIFMPIGRGALTLPLLSSCRRGKATLKPEHNTHERTHADEHDGVELGQLADGNRQNEEQRDRPQVQHAQQALRAGPFIEIEQ